MASLSLNVGCHFEGAPGIDLQEPDAAPPIGETESCGDTTLDADEQCDDGNASSGDGCSNACELEPGFECIGAGTDCNRVTGIEWTDPVAVSPNEIGSPIGGSQLCGNGCDCESDQALVGLEGGFRPNQGRSYGVAQLRPICASLSFDLDGVASLSTTDVGDVLGRYETSSTTTVMCPDGAIINGLRGLNVGGGYVGALELDCTPLAHDGAIVFGTEIPPGGRIGTSGTLSKDSICPIGQLAIGLDGQSGEVVDRLLLRCASIEAAL